MQWAKWANAPPPLFSLAPFSFSLSLSLCFLSHVMMSLVLQRRGQQVIARLPCIMVRMGCCKAPLPRSPPSTFSSMVNGGMEERRKRRDATTQKSLETVLSFVLYWDCGLRLLVGRAIPWRRARAGLFF